MTEVVPYSPGCLCISCNLEILMLIVSALIISFASLLKVLCCKRRSCTNVEKQTEVNPWNESNNPPTDPPILINEQTRTQSTSPIIFLPTPLIVEKIEEEFTPKIPKECSNQNYETSACNEKKSSLPKSDDDEVVNKFINQAKDEELLGNLNESVEMITLAISLLPTKPKLYETRCNFLRKIGLYQEALEDAFKVYELCPSSESLALIGETLLQMGKPKESEIRFIEGINLNKDCQKCQEGLFKIRTMEVSDLTKRGDEEFNRNQYGDSALFYTQAISLIPSAELYEKRAASLGKQGLYHQSQADWSRAEEFKNEASRKRLAEELERPSKYTKY